MVIPGAMGITDAGLRLIQGEDLPTALAHGAGTGAGSYALSRAGGIAGGLAGLGAGALMRNPVAGVGLGTIGALAGSAAGFFYGADKGNDVAIDLLNKHLSQQ